MFIYIDYKTAATSILSVSLKKLSVPRGHSVSPKHLSCVVHFSLVLVGDFISSFFASFCEEGSDPLNFSSLPLCWDVIHFVSRLSHRQVSSTKKSTPLIRNFVHLNVFIAMETCYVRWETSLPNENLATCLALMLYSLSQTLSAIKAPIESQEVIRRASKRSKRQVTGADDRRGTKRNTTMNEFFSFFLTIATTHQPQEGRNRRQEAFEVDRKWKNKTFRQLKWAFWNIQRGSTLYELHMYR